MTDLSFSAKFQPEAPLLDRLVRDAALSPDTRARISDRAANLIRRIRAESKPTMMELMLAEYGLSTREGVALMCLAEAMLRVPDRATIDALIEDKIAPSDWGRHLGDSSSSLVNASTWALMLTGRVLDDSKPGGRHPARRGPPPWRAGDPHRRHPRDARDGAPVRPGPDHRRRAGAGEGSGGQGIHLQL